MLPENSLYFVALGAAMAKTAQRVSPEELAQKTEGYTSKRGYLGCDPLFRDEAELEAFRRRHDGDTGNTRMTDTPVGALSLGIDAGSTTVKAVLVDEEGNLFRPLYTSNSGNPGPILRQYLTDLYRDCPDIRITSSCVTGYGEQLIRAAFGVDMGLVETVAHYTAAERFCPDVDFIMPFPDSGVYSAVGFAQCAELPYEHAMIRNHYVGRTFIQPTQSMRNFGVRVKINPVRSMIEGKKICIVDDSIVRGTTMITRVKKLRELGAKEVHIRISCPPVKFPCFYGIDFASRGELIAAKYSLPEITKMLDVDSLHYLSIDGLLRSVMQSDSYCLACFDGNYPVPCRESGKLRLECGGCCGSR